MPYAQRLYICPDCNMPVVKRANPAAVVRCVACAIAYSLEYQRQLHARSGPLYDQWLAANLAGALRAVAAAAPAESP